MNFKGLLAMAACCVALSGCYNTRLVSGAPAATEQEDRQWFTLGGFVPISGPHTARCKRIARSESGLRASDIGIGLGIAVLGGVAGALACPDSRETCTTVGANLGTLLLGTRTVRYQCAE